VADRVGHRPDVSCPCRPATPLTSSAANPGRVPWTLAEPDLFVHRVMPKPNASGSVNHPWRTFGEFRG
jgi:hypothetical protein